MLTWKIAYLRNRVKTVISSRKEVDARMRIWFRNKCHMWPVPRCNFMLIPSILFIQNFVTFRVKSCKNQPSSGPEAEFQCFVGYTQTGTGCNLNFAASLECITRFRRAKIPSIVFVLLLPPFFKKIFSI